MNIIITPWLELINKRKRARLLLIDYVPAMDDDSLVSKVSGMNIEIGSYTLINAVRLNNELATTIHALDSSERVMRTWELTACI